MHTTTLGRTGLKVSVAGLGCGGNSRIGMGAGLSEAESVALVRQALDLGVNLIDTAAAYGTEGLVGKAIKGRWTGRRPRSNTPTARWPAVRTTAAWSR